MSRAQLGIAVDLDKETIGRYERGEWERPLKRPMLEAIADATEIPAKYRDVGFLQPDDPVTRFADAARREAELRNEHPAPSSEDLDDEDASDATS